MSTKFRTKAIRAQDIKTLCGDLELLIANCMCDFHDQTGISELELEIRMHKVAENVIELTVCDPAARWSDQ